MAKKKSARAATPSDRNRWVMIGVAATLVAVAAVAVYVFAFSGGGGSSNKGNVNKPKPTPVAFDSQTANVDVVDNKFTPPIIKIKQGTTVTWHFKGNVAHTVTSVAGTGIKFDSGGRPKGKTYDFTFDTPGKFDYYCNIHHIMEGTIYVTDASGNLPTPTVPATVAPTSTP